MRHEFYGRVDRVSDYSTKTNDRETVDHRRTWILHFMSGDFINTITVQCPDQKGMPEPGSPVRIELTELVEKED